MRQTRIWHCGLFRMLAVGLAIQAITATFPPPASAESGTVVGTLVGTDGQPLRNVAVEVRDASGSTVATGTTDGSGKFSITADAIHPGNTYSICSAAGCGTVVAMTPAAAAIAGVSTTGLIAIGVGVAGATGLGIGINEAVGGGGEAPASRSR